MIVAEKVKFKVNRSPFAACGFSCVSPGSPKYLEVSIYCEMNTVLKG